MKAAAVVLLLAVVFAVAVAFGELSHAHLTVERRPGCFATHTLLRAYAAELLRETSTGVVSSLARRVTPRPS